MQKVRYVSKNPSHPSFYILVRGPRDAWARKPVGSQALDSTLTTLRQRIAGFEAQTELAASTDFSPGA